MKFTGLNLVLVIGIASAGKIADQSGRIVGGTDAAPGQIPYIASLRWLGLHHFCGASIIRKNFVLTAGHCMEGYVPEDVGVAVGALLLSDGGFLHQCTRIITHPNYTIYQVTSDVALVQVADPFVYNLEVQPIGISNQYIEGDVAARVSGWGMTHHENNQLPNHLQTLATKTITTDDCDARHTDYSEEYFVNTICSLNEIGQGICFGDSGGSLVVGDYVVGIASWVIPCAQGYPDVYARVSSHFDWIVGEVGTT